MQRLKNASIGVRMLAVAGVAALCMVALGGLSAAQMRSERYHDREKATRDVVTLAVGIVESYAKQEAAGTLTRAQAQAGALRVLKGLRYGNGDYIWVNDLNTRMVMHPTKPALDGTDVSGMKDPDGIPSSSGSSRSSARTVRGSCPTSGPSRAGRSRRRRSVT